jgi:hypothetical protein
VGRWRAVVIGFRPEMVAAVATVVVRYDSCVVAICSFTLLSSSFFSLYFGFCVLYQLIMCIGIKQKKKENSWSNTTFNGQYLLYQIYF